MWVRVVRRELKRRGRRVGRGRSPGVHRYAHNPDECPSARRVLSCWTPDQPAAAEGTDVLSPVQAGRDIICAKLTPVPPDTSVLLFGEMVPDQHPA